MGWPDCLWTDKVNPCNLIASKPLWIKKKEKHCENIFAVVKKMFKHVLYPKRYKREIFNFKSFFTCFSQWIISKKIPLDILTMEKLLQAVNKQASLVSKVPLVEFDEKNFQQFMLKNPVWDFHGVSREDYLTKRLSENN